MPLLLPDFRAAVLDLSVDRAEEAVTMIRVIVAETVLKTSPEMKFQSLGTGQPTVIVSLTSGYLYTANQTTESFLRAIDGEKSFGSIVSELLEVYDVSAEKLALDLGKLGEQLLNENLLLLVGEGVTHA